MPNNNSLSLKFKLFNLLFEPPSIGKAIGALTGALARISVGFPESQLPSISISSEMKE